MKVSMGWFLLSSSIFESHFLGDIVLDAKLSVVIKLLKNKCWVVKLRGKKIFEHNSSHTLICMKSVLKTFL